LFAEYFAETFDYLNLEMPEDLEGEEFEDAMEEAEAAVWK